MKRFVFSLEAILLERKRQEDMRLQEWTTSLEKFKNLEIARHKLETDLSRAIDESTLLATIQENHVGEFQTMDAFIRGTQLRIQWKTLEIDKVQKHVDRKRSEYVHARQRREALEKLKARKLAEFKDRSHKVELRAVDDIYINSHQRRDDEEEEVLHETR